MQAFNNTVKGHEVLFFEDAEVEKYKGDHQSFGSAGTLYVLYFRDYNRFVLQLNDWKFPLLRRLPIIHSADKTDITKRTYILPGLNGFTYQLKINNIPNHQALINFETILSHNSLFSGKGEDTSSRKIETSPDDKLVRSQKSKDTGAKEIITENVKSFAHKVMNKAATFKNGTKNLTSTKRRINLNDIKNKDFRADAKSSFKSNYLRDHEKNTYEWFSLQRSNKNLTEAQEIGALAKTSNTPIHHIFREDIEESILRQKDLVSQGNFSHSEKTESKGFVQNLKEGFSNLASRASLKKDNIIAGNRDTLNTLKEEKLTQLESTHHSEA